jgi:hypothetical protein
MSSHGIELIGNDFAANVILSGNISTGLYYSGRPADKSFAAGIAVTDTGGRVDIELLDGSVITTYGAQSPGIQIESALQASVDMGGSIVTHGSYSSGISIDTVTGDVAVTVSASGTITAQDAQSDGISIVDTTGQVNVITAGSIMGGAGDGAGVALDNPGATASTITVESGGSLGALSDVAIRATEPVTISNAGTITGIVTLGDGDDGFTNSGTWYLRHHADTDGDGVRETEDAARADFGSGEDQFVNTGTLSLSKGTASLWQGQIVGLETFTHSGTIDLQDGTPGDTLTISGNFQSDGGSLLLDVMLDDGTSSPQADVLYLYQVSQPTAATKIYLTNAGGNGVIGGTGILLVDADFDESGGEAFTLGQAVIGAYEYELHYDNADDAWYLRNLVTDTGSPSIFSGTEEYPALMTAALLSFGADWSALHNRLQDVRFANEKEKIEPAAWTGASARLRPWLQLSGARQEMASEASFDQQVMKLTGGADVPVSLEGGGRALIGAFAGTGRNAQEFDGSITEAESDVALAGVYAAYRSGGFYGNAIVKYEHHWADLHSEATSDGGAPFELDIWGGSLENGYRFQFEHAYVQPRVRLNYAQAAATRLEDASGERIDLEAAESLAGEAAARLGLVLGSGEIYVDGGMRHEFLGETEAEVSGLTFTDALPGTSGFVSGGLLLRMIEDKVLLSLEAGYAKGDEAEEFTASAALRVVY